MNQGRHDASGGGALWRVMPALVLWAGMLQAAPSVDLSAGTARLPADGATLLTITAVCRDGGTYVRDGATVLFTANAGDLLAVGSQTRSGLEYRATVSGGRAQVLLRATAYDTVIMVQARLLDPPSSAAEVAVRVGAATGPGDTGDNILKVRGDRLFYYPRSPQGVVDALGHASVSYQGVEIHAPHLQVSTTELVVIAKDPGGLAQIGLGPPPYRPRKPGAKRGPPYVGDALMVELQSFSGLIFSALTGEMLFFQGAGLQPVAPRTMPPGMLDWYDADMDVNIQAKRIAVYPNRKIRFDQPKFFINDRKVLSLPYHFEELGYSGSTGGALAQMVSYSTQDGLILDLPYYFDVTDRDTNAIRLQRGARAGLFGRQTGMQVIYQHHDELKQERGEQDFTIDNWFKNFGLTYSRSQRFNADTSANVSLAWPQHHDFYSSSNLYSLAGPGNLSVSSNIDYLRGQSAGLSVQADAVWQSRPVRFKPLKLQSSLTLGTGLSHLFGGTELYRQSVGLSFSRDPLDLWAGGMMLPSASVRFQNSIHGSRDTSFTFNHLYRQTLTSGLTASVGYTFDLLRSNKYKSPDRHTLTTNLELDLGQRLRGSGYGSYNLGDRSLSGSLQLDSLFTQHLGTRVQTLYQTSSAGSFHETEFWLYRLVGARELRLRYNLEQGRMFFEIDNHY